MPESAQLLLVEDDRQLATMLEQILVGEGYDVDVARDGQRGLHLGLTRDLRRHRARPRPAGDRGPGPAGPAALPRSGDARAGAVRARQPGRPRGRARRGRRGLHEQAVRRRRARGAAARAASSARASTAATLHVPARHARRGHPAGHHLVRGAPWTSRSAECSLLELLARHPRQVFSRPEILDRVFTGRRGRGRGRHLRVLPAPQARPVDACRPSAARGTGWVPDDHADHDGAERDALRRTARAAGPADRGARPRRASSSSAPPSLLVVVRAQRRGGDGPGSRRRCARSTTPTTLLPACGSRSSTPVACRLSDGLPRASPTSTSCGEVARSGEDVRTTAPTGAGTVTRR